MMGKLDSDDWYLVLSHVTTLAKDYDHISFYILLVYMFSDVTAVLFDTIKYVICKLSRSHRVSDGKVIDDCRSKCVSYA